MDEAEHAMAQQARPFAQRMMICGRNSPIRRLIRLIA